MRQGTKVGQVEYVDKAISNHVSESSYISSHSSIYSDPCTETVPVQSTVQSKHSGIELIVSMLGHLLVVLNLLLLKLSILLELKFHHHLVLQRRIHPVGELLILRKLGRAVSGDMLTLLLLMKRSMCIHNRTVDVSSDRIGKERRRSTIVRTQSPRDGVKLFDPRTESQFSVDELRVSIGW